MEETELKGNALNNGQAAGGLKTSPILFLLAAAVATVAMACIAAVSSARASAPNRAAIVVTFGDGATITRCVEFAEAEITGAELLQRSGLNLVTWGTGGGAAVCKIEDDGCDNPNNCFCQCRGADCRYWAYYNLDAGRWQYAQIGSTQRKVHDGDVDGWAWGSGNAGEGATPQLMTFEDVCAPIAPTFSPPLPTSPLPPPSNPTVAPPTLPAATEIPLTIAPPTLNPTDSKTPAETSNPVVAATPRPSPVAILTPTSDNGEDGGLPLQIAAFGGIAGVLVAAAGALFWRRARG